jgi:hypothetical protein
VAALRAASAALGVIGAGLMAASPFPHWYHLDTGDSNFDVSGWDAFETTDLLLVGAAVLTLFILVRRSREPAIAGRRLLVLGATMAAIVGIQLIDKTPLFAFTDSFEVELRIGAWMALAGALLVLAAGALTSRRVA